ncbi:MAG: phosphonate metabolism transcriptional regulator PhnF [Rhizobiales bacterium]|nr:phosphonate metabolism transcriptional regulator PhnF [Hyphomicrobiales bacterium]
MTGTGIGVERGAGVAIWRQLASRLEEDITTGRFEANARLPTEAALAAQFRVNRHTVRRAIGALAEQGLVRVEQGRGAFVEDVIIDYPLRHRTSFSANLLEQGREPAHRIIGVDELRADARIASGLNVRRGAKVVVSHAIGLADGVPMNLSISVFPHARFPGLAGRLQEEISISKTLATYGLADYHRRETRILTRMPTADEARHLRQPSSQPVLVTEAVDVDGEDRPIRLGITCFAGTRVQITVGAAHPA